MTSVTKTKWKLARALVHHTVTRRHERTAGRRTMPAHAGGAGQHAAAEHADGDVIMRAVHVDHPRERRRRRYAASHRARGADAGLALLGNHGHGLAIETEEFQWLSEAVGDPVDVAELSVPVRHFVTPIIMRRRIMLGRLDERVDLIMTVHAVYGHRRRTRAVGGVERGRQRERVPLFREAEERRGHSLIVIVRCRCHPVITDHGHHGTP